MRKPCVERHQHGRPIGVTTSFYDLGGHSMLAVRRVDRIYQAIKKRIPLVELG